MRQILPEQPFIWLIASSGAADIVVDEITLTATGVGTNSEVANLRLKNTNPDFVDTDEIDGFYRPRFWMQDLPAITQLEFKYLLGTTETFGTTSLVSGIQVPRVYQDTENITKATYWDSVTESLRFIKLQMQVGTPFATRRNTEWNDGANARLVVEWDRQATGKLDPSYAEPNSDHLWLFSTVDVYLNHVYNGKTQRWLMGWSSDEDTTLTQAKETVEFMKGKPSAVAAKFYSKITDSIKFSLASADPFVWGIAKGITPVLQNGHYVFKEENKQRPIQKFYFTVEWFTNAGHLCQFIIPTGQIFMEGDLTPGGGDIAKQGLTITPTVQSCSTVVTELHISSSPVQRAALCVGFDTGTA